MKKNILVLAALLLALLLAGCGEKPTAYRPDTSSSSQAQTGDTGLLVPENDEDEEGQAFRIVDADPVDLDYQYDAALGGIIINGYNAYEEAVRIPEQINGDPVVQIKKIENGFLRLIELPDSVIEIGNSAFSGCTGLQSVTLPNGIAAIPDGAFNRCTALENIIIPDSVTAIGSHAFSGCTSLQSITLPNSVAAIGERAFQECTSLQSVTLPNSVVTIGASVFNKCTSLQGITFPDGIVMIPYEILSYCTALESVALPNSVVCVGNGAFSGCSALTSVAIPEGVQYLDRNAFKGCTALRNMELPDTARFIDKGAFDGCSALTLAYKGNTYNYTNFEEIYTDEILLDALKMSLDYKIRLAEAEGTEYYEDLFYEAENNMSWIDEKITDPGDRAAIDALVDLLS